jgi:hypothetical protein
VLQAARVTSLNAIAMALNVRGVLIVATIPRRNYTFWTIVTILNATGLEIGQMDLPLVEPGDGSCDSRIFGTLKSSASLPG